MSSEWFDLEVWQQTSFVERQLRLERLCLALDGFHVVAGEDILRVVHERTQLAFSFVPRATFEAGLTANDLAALRSAVDVDDEELAVIAAACAPRTRVTAGPLLMSTRPLSSQENARLSGGSCDYDTPVRRVARALAAQCGFRLPTDAEVELVRRDGGLGAFFVDLSGSRARELRSSFGIERVHMAEWTDDLETGWRPGVDLPFQSDDELPLALAALRARPDDDDDDVPDCVARWVLDVADVARRTAARFVGQT